MSALELYTPMTQFPNLAAIISMIVLVCAMFLIQINIHLMYADEVDRLKMSIDKRITALHEDVDETIQRLKPLEEITKTLLEAQEENDAELEHHDELLEEHGEDISLVAEMEHTTRRGIAPLVRNVVATLNNPPAREYHLDTFAFEYSSLDVHIKKYLSSSKAATAREIFKHLTEDKATTEMILKSTGGNKITRHHVNSRLYSLLAHGELKKDDSARPVWSL